MKGLPSLKVVVLISVVAWAYLARTSVPWWVGHPGAFLAGLAVAFVLGSITLSEAGGVGDLANGVGAWFGAIGSQEGNRGATITGVGLIAVTLWMGHASIWLAYRRSFALLAALPGLGVLLVVLTFLPPDYYWYFFMYLLAAAPGIAYRYHGRWSVKGQRVAGTFGALVVGLLLMSVTVAAAWRAPAPEGTVMPLVSKLEKPWYSFRDRWSNLFYGVPDRKEWGFFSPPDDLQFRTPVELGEDLLFVVESPQPYRWRMRIYETYTNSGWVSDEAPVEMALAQAPLREYVSGLKARNETEIDVRVYAKANTLVSAGEPLGASIPSDVDLSSWPGSSPGPPLAVLGQRILVPPREYSTVGSVSEAASDMLREAGRNYPDWVTDRYLQLPDDFPSTVKSLARELTWDQETPYDMAQIIRLYLHGLPYSLDVESPPPGQDWVEYFLFVQLEGFCQNYASAMITMLRSLGVPARLVVGYAPGVWDEGRGVWKVQARHYHAWPEVYFPGYGWVEFEPTPADVQPALESLGIRPQGRLPRSLSDDT